MKITSISATCGTGFNDPYEAFRNHRVAITLTADIEDGDDPDACRRELQRRAKDAADADRQRILDLRQIEDEIAAVTGEIYLPSPDHRDRLLKEIDKLNERADQLRASYQLAVSRERREQIAAAQFPEDGGSAIIPPGDGRTI